MRAQGSAPSALSRGGKRLLEEGRRGAVTQAPGEMAHQDPRGLCTITAMSSAARKERQAPDATVWSPWSVRRLVRSMTSCGCGAG